MLERKKQLEEQFRQEFIQLLQKYNNATLSVEDHWQGYPECGSDIQARIESYDKYDLEGNMIEPGIDFDLGRYITSI